MFKIHAPDTERFAQLDNFLAQNQGNFDYNGLVIAFNSAPVGSIIEFPYRKGKLASLSSALEDRGLKRNVDFNATGGHSGVLPDGKVDENSSWDVVLKRMTDATGTPISPKPRGKAGQAANAAAGAAVETTGTTTTAAAAEKPKAGKK